MLEGRVDVNTNQKDKRAWQSKLYLQQLYNIAIQLCVERSEIEIQFVSFSVMKFTTNNQTLYNTIVDSHYPWCQVHVCV